MTKQRSKRDGCDQDSAGYCELSSVHGSAVSMESRRYRERAGPASSQLPLSGVESRTPCSILETRRGGKFAGRLEAFFAEPSPKGVLFRATVERTMRDEGTFAPRVGKYVPDAPALGKFASVEHGSERTCPYGQRPTATSGCKF